jgi:hypothetical protein
MNWITVQEVLELGVARQTLNRRIKSGVWESRLGLRRSKGNGARLREVKLESLPADLQVKWFRKFEDADEGVRGPTDGSLTTEQDDVAVELSAAGAEAEDIGKGDGLGRLTEALKRYAPDVREAFQAEALRLSSIVTKYLALDKRQVLVAPGVYDFVPEVKDLCQEAICSDPVVLAVEPRRKEAPAPTTLRLWASSFKKIGLAAFLRKAPERQKPVDRRVAVIEPAAAGEWLNSNWRKFASARKLHQAWTKQAVKNGWTIPSYGWVYRKHSQMAAIVKTFVFKGEKAYVGKYAPFVPRTVSDLTALQVLVGDHSVRDVAVMLPDGSLTRPWLTLWQDLRTGLIWGWHLDLVPSSTTIGLAYVNGVKTFGAQPLPNPETGYQSYLYTDQGKDYRCKTLTGDTLTFKEAAKIDGGLQVLCTQRNVGFMSELGIKHIMARGYNAREKAVERTHRDISAWEQNTFENEYCGKDVTSKPDRFVWSCARHAKLLKKFDGKTEWLKAESPFMTLDDYRENIAGWINEYNHTAHTRAVLSGSRVVPIEEYERLYTTRYEISEEALALLLMKAIKRKIGKNGVQMFQQHWYFMTEEMAPFKGQEIEVRFTDGDYMQIWAVLPNGQIVQAPLITPTSIISPNKRTMAEVARLKAADKKTIRDFRFLQESTYRGMSAEDRVAAQLNEEKPDKPESQRMVVNSRPQVISATRFDVRRSSGSKTPAVTQDQVERATVIEGMFGTDRPEKRIKEEWED